MFGSGLDLPKHSRLGFEVTLALGATPGGGCLATIGWHGWMKAAGAFNGLPRS
jgi:hypothetical protein